MSKTHFNEDGFILKIPLLGVKYRNFCTYFCRDH